MPARPRLDSRSPERAHRLCAIIVVVEIQMLNSGTRNDACETIDADLAESIVLQAYVQLPLLPRHADGSWVAPLRRFAHCDLRLVESVPASSDEPVLRVELFDRRTRSAVKV